MEEGYSHPSSLRSLPTISLLLLSLLLARLIYNYTRLPSTIPGPLLASITDLYRFYHQNTHHGLRSTLLRLHAKHGPIIRYAVRSISISSPTAIPPIYDSRTPFTTALSYSVLIGISNGREVPSLVSTSDEAAHAALRRSIASAFTPSGIAPLESRIDASVTALHAYLLSISKSGEKINLPQTLLHFSMDSASSQAFSTQPGYLSLGKDTDGSIAAIRARFKHWGRWSSLPGLERLIYRNPISIRRKQTPSAMAALAASKLKAHLEASASADTDIGKDSANDEENPDLLTTFLAASKSYPKPLTPTGITGLLMSTISGAGDTTATTLVAILFYLYTYSDILAKLRLELSSANLSTPVPANAQLKNLPYLNATIKESMRLFSTPTWPIERLVPSHPTPNNPTNTFSILGYDIPPGTSVGVLPAAIHLDKATFGDDVDVFRPDRWLEGDSNEDEERRRRMEATFMGFSRGRRACLGKEVALLQVRKVIAMIVGEDGFEIDFEESGKDGKEGKGKRLEDVAKIDFSPAVAMVENCDVRILKRQNGVEKE